jgi:ATP-dependent Clp protease protease subunit
MRGIPSRFREIPLDEIRGKDKNGGRFLLRRSGSRKSKKPRIYRLEENMTNIERHLLNPSQNAYGEYQRHRNMTVGDLLLENRIIFLQGAIDSASANELIMELLYLQSDNRKKDIQFYINSPGGSVSAMLAIYDTMQILSCPVATYCVGLAASGGAVLLAGGAKGKRFALPHSKIMIHQPWGGVSGQVSDIEIQAQQVLQDRDTLNRILAEHTGKTVEQIAQDTDRDYYMTAQEAKDYGLVDGIFSSQKPEGEDEDEDE